MAARMFKLPLRSLALDSIPLKVFHCYVRVQTGKDSLTIRMFILFRYFNVDDALNPSSHKIG